MMHESFHNFDYMINLFKWWPKPRGKKQMELFNIPQPCFLLPLHWPIYTRKPPSHETQADGFELQSSKYTAFLEEIYAPLWNSC